MHSIWSTWLLADTPDMLLMRYLMALNLSIEHDIAVFVDITVLPSHGCDHVSAHVPYHQS